jgi:hypothetical protein
MAVGALLGLVAVLGAFLRQDQPAQDRGPPKQMGHALSALPLGILTEPSRPEHNHGPAAALHRHPAGIVLAIERDLRSAKRTKGRRRGWEDRLKKTIEFNEILWIL